MLRLTFRRHGGAIHKLHSRSLESPELLHRLRQSLLGSAELNHARLQVVQCTLNQTVLLLVMRQEEMPQRMLYHDQVLNVVSTERTCLMDFLIDLPCSKPWDFLK
jgi:hypothetical protein